MKPATLRDAPKLAELHAASFHRGWDEQEFADLISERQMEYGALMAYEVGKTRLESLGEVEEAADLLRYYAQTFEENGGFDHPMGNLGDSAVHTRSILRAHGVFAVIADAAIDAPIRRHRDVTPRGPEPPFHSVRPELIVKRQFDLRRNLRDIERDDLPALQLLGDRIGHAQKVRCLQCHRPLHRAAQYGRPNIFSRIGEHALRGKNAGE